ncbi:hypothetical protein BDC45DRAFT_556435 [Circinella umbellata]|nr:hypothetical protein BDC45DRAFT_556435 [Circinella umbellata]
MLKNSVCSFHLSILSLAQPKCVKLKPLETSGNYWRLQVKCTIRLPETIHAESSLKELFIFSVVLFVASGIREQEIKLDFFFAHAVTSVHAIYTILPYLTAIQAELLLRAHFAETLMYYVGRGRPSLQLDLLANYISPQAIEDSENPWLNVIHLALKAEESHCIKAVRAIATAQIAYGNPSSFGNDILLKAAQVTVDIGGKSSVPNVAWNFAGIGFKETWENPQNDLRW